MNVSVSAINLRRRRHCTQHGVFADFRPIGNTAVYVVNQEAAARINLQANKIRTGIHHCPRNRRKHLPAGRFVNISVPCVTRRHPKVFRHR